MTTYAVSFFVPGIPVAQPRARVAKGRAYTDKETGIAGWKSAIRGMAKAHEPPARLRSVALEVVFLMPKAPDGKPDLDNLLKAVMDALTGKGQGWWADDCQVVQVVAAKVLATGKPGCNVKIRGILQEARA